MDSEQNNSTSFSPSEPILCVNGCGFFGSPSNMNLCSKCYRDITLAQAASVQTAIEKSLNTKFQSFEISRSSSSTRGCDSAESSSDQPKSTKRTRCSSCNKKVGIASVFKCRCGSSFCGTHRYPESHDCEFDYKVGVSEAIGKANPLVKADKIDRI